MNPGFYNQLSVLRLTGNGAYLDDGKDGVLLPKRFVPADTKVGDVLNVFVYHDSESRLIATTEKPKGIAGEIVFLKLVDTAPHGAFFDWGLMKDLFVPRSKMLDDMHVGNYYFAQIFVDEKTGRVAANTKIDFILNNENLTVEENEKVHLTVYRRSNIGYVVIINHKHTGVLHFSDVFRPIQVGDSFEGYVKKIREENKIDVAVGTQGYSRVEDEGDKILRLLNENNGFLPYHDKSAPEDIYAFFEMSKKTFKMTLGNLYKQHKILITEKGISLSKK